MLKPYNLQYFAEGGTGATAPASAVSGESGSSATGADGISAETRQQMAAIRGQAPKSRQDIRTNRDAKQGTGVVTEQVTPSAAEKPAPATTEAKVEPDKKAAFEKFIAENPDLATEWHNKAFKKRYDQLNAKQAELQQQLDTVSPVLEAMKSKYGAKDVADLVAKVNADDELYADAADAEGMTIPAFKKMKQQEALIAKMNGMKAEQEAQEKIRVQVQDWKVKAVELKKVYPDFDLNKELNNPEPMNSTGGPTKGQYFIDMLRGGVLPMQHIYETIHLEEIKQKTAASTAATVKQQTVASIQSRGERPAENGASSKAGGSYSVDVKNMTPQQRREIEKRVARGEVITFK